MGHAVVAAGVSGRNKKASREARGQGKPVDFREFLRAEPDSRITIFATWRANIGSDGSGRTNAHLVRRVRGKKTPVWFAPNESCPFSPSPASGPTGPVSARRRRSYRRRLRFSDCDPNRRVEAHQSQGDAGNPYDERRVRRLATRRLGRGQSAVAPSAGRHTPDRCERREGRPSAPSVLHRRT